MFGQNPTSFDFYRELVETRQGVEWNNLLLDGISNSLFSIHDEIAQVRRMNAETLAIQQELLNREVVQGKLEEFIYQIEKMVNEFQNPATEVVPSTQYFLLLGLLKTIQAEGISTAIIRSRDNKAAFEAGVNKASALLKQLQNHPEVQQALAWAKEEQKRLEIRKAEEQKRLEAKKAEEEEARRKKAEENERRRQALHKERESAKQHREAEVAALNQQMERLSESKKKLTFTDWYQEKFKWAIEAEPPKPLLYQGAVWIFGWFAIPIWFYFAAKAADAAWNPEVNAQIKQLRERILVIREEEAKAKIQQVADEIDRQKSD